LPYFVLARWLAQLAAGVLACLWLSGWLAELGCYDQQWSGMPEEKNTSTMRVPVAWYFEQNGRAAAVHPMGLGLA
jgi:hypothetical protein